VKEISLGVAFSFWSVAVSSLMAIPASMPPVLPWIW
jgi:hypothetical protein